MFSSTLVSATSVGTGRGIMGGLVNSEQIVIDMESLYRSMRGNLLTSQNTLDDGERCTIRRVIYDERTPVDCPYDPKVISLGPFHRGKEALKPTEEVKWRYLNNMLCGKEDDLQKYIEAAQRLEPQVRCCYSEPSQLSSNDFVEMLVLDGCFLIDFLAKSRFHKDEVMEDFGWQLPWVMHDILLFENQIPFFVLETLYQVYVNCRNSIEGNYPILDIAVEYLYLTELWDQKRNFWLFYSSWKPQPEIKDAAHLLHLYHKVVIEVPHKAGFSLRKVIVRWIKLFFWSLLGIVYWPMFFLHQFFFTNSMYPTKITASTELEEAGVRLQGSFMNLKFENGTLFIPIFFLDKYSFSLLKNLIALEIYHPTPIYPYIYQYARFLTELIKSPKDLAVMESHHIITTPNKDEGMRLVTKLVSGLELRGQRRRGRVSGYWQQPRLRREQMMRYCEQPHHRWRAKLMKDYFNSPWSIIGLLVGFILLVLALLQTIFTIFPYYNPRN